MDLHQHLDGYCERLDASYWAEPLNALTNAAFIIAAIIMWRRSADVPMARVLSGILFAIGVGSYLFHTHATVWAMLTDVIPIGVFILTYLFAVNRDVVGLKGWQAGLATAMFIPYAAAMVPLLNLSAFLAISNFYWTVPILIAAYAAFLWKRYPVFSRGMLIGAGILCVSITLRSLDEILCHVIPIGTHIWWHILNGIMLGWMIEVYRRHRLRD